MSTSSSALPRPSAAPVRRTARSTGSRRGRRAKEAEAALAELPTQREQAEAALAELQTQREQERRRHRQAEQAISLDRVRQGGGPKPGAAAFERPRRDGRDPAACEGLSSPHRADGVSANRFEPGPRCSVRSRPWSPSRTQTSAEAAMENGAPQRAVGHGLEATGESSARPVPGPDDVQAATHETLTGSSRASSPSSRSSRSGFAVWILDGAAAASDIEVFLILYLATGSGCPSASTACSRTAASDDARGARHPRDPRLGRDQGPLISLVADHRKHHAFADKPGDPRHPHVDHRGG